MGFAATVFHCCATLYFGTRLRCFRRELGVNLEVKKTGPLEISKKRIVRLALMNAMEASGCR
jgi:hypothetical protein